MLSALYSPFLESAVCLNTYFSIGCHAFVKYNMPEYSQFLLIREKIN